MSYSKLDGVTIDKYSPNLYSYYNQTFYSCLRQFGMLSRRCSFVIDSCSSLFCGEKCLPYASVCLKHVTSDSQTILLFNACQVSINASTSSEGQSQQKSQICGLPTLLTAADSNQPLCSKHKRRTVYKSYGNLTGNTK